MSEAVVACCQVALAVGDPDGNRAAVDRMVRQAASRGAQVVVVPELAPSGYVFRDPAEARSLAEPVEGPTVSGWSELSAELDILLVGGFCEQGEDGAVHNSAVLVERGAVRAVYRKAHLWDREPLAFTAGDAAPPVVQTAVGRIGVMVCYDLEFPEWVRMPALAGAELICAPVNWPSVPRPAHERPAEVVRVQANAAVNRVFVAACDRTGPERGVDWVGGSVIVDPDGWPLAGPLTAADAQPILAVCRLEQARDKAVGPRNDVHGDRRPALYDAVRATERA